MYDAYLDTMLLGQRDLMTRAAAAAWEGRAAAIRDAEWDLAQAMQGRLAEMLQHPITRERTEVHEAEGGALVEVRIVEPAGWSYREMAQLAKEGSRLARLAAGLPTEGARYPTPDAGSEAMSDVDAFLKGLEGEVSSSSEQQVSEPSNVA
jgi:hypothetical protein